MKRLFAIDQEYQNDDVRVPNLRTLLLAFIAGYVPDSLIASQLQLFNNIFAGADFDDACKKYELLLPYLQRLARYTVDQAEDSRSCELLFSGHLFDKFTHKQQKLAKSQDTGTKRGLRIHLVHC